MFYTKKPQVTDIQLLADFKSGERGIRTPGTLRYAGFQDRCIRPLYHLSLQMVAVVFGLFASAKVGGFI